MGRAGQAGGSDERDWLSAGLSAALATLAWASPRVTGWLPRHARSLPAPSLSDLHETTGTYEISVVKQGETGTTETVTMTLADQAAITGHDGQVTSGGKPGRPKRRTFTAAYKARILAAFDALPEGSPERGALLRKERLYHSHLEDWRRQQALPGLQEPVACLRVGRFGT